MNEQDSPKRPTKYIVVLGGSYAGASTAHYILKHVIPSLPTKNEYNVILISASTHALCRPATPRALISDDFFAQDKLFVPLSQAFDSYTNFRLIHGTATKLDHENRKVTVNVLVQDVVQTEEIVDFHALVIATGASTASPLLGFSNGGGVENLRASWDDFRKALSNARRIVIVGGGPAGVETAGELGEFLNGRPGWFCKTSPPKVEITIITAGSRVLPILRDSLAAKAEYYLSLVGVKILKDTRVISVSPVGAGTVNVATKATITLQDGTTLDTDLYIPATGLEPNTSFIDPTLLSPTGHVDTNSSTLRVDKAGPRIYAIGDVASYARPAVHLTLEAVPVLCANLKRDLGGENAAKEDRIFKEDTRETQLVPIGKSYGVGAAMGYQLPSWLVWAIKGRDYWLWTTGGLWSGKQWAKES
ncbi:hypothetical protein BCR39DRAFT_533967 [Naematelia encephala]|uniref:FAD/NAD(P)-binding domain-containing protein n=1 Tax=Naematelia encephala TaxID=71784 RepID=A0A1Y2B240_9TREE|nr:hypothetical protein BCR39DRAFT_533967 [Naematelia encephala]